MNKKMQNAWWKKAGEKGEEKKKGYELRNPLRDDEGGNERAPYMMICIMYVISC